MRYRINTPSIIYEILDGEAVILNLDEGIYYSLNETGKEIWNLIGVRRSVQEMAGVFDASEGDAFIQSKISEFISQLEKEKMIVHAEEQSAAPSERLEKKPFTAPVLHIYNDMKELLLLDPIHEVDQAGWPIA